MQALHIRQAAQTLKRTANIIGLIRLTQTAYEIERGATPQPLERALRESIQIVKSKKSHIQVRQ
ncbi:hypothetical protein C0081_04970 [Cohaesibacter celericrescens]|uniref:Uncharacterized protein n=1 Tax=Cohaesibacter celericrescens TaxID=2067669 RepID=A0A2N5XUL6_9HYPH|nr:hypothetical protein C0081_04970 [Cohaesibacter celericrescens]